MSVTALEDNHPSQKQQDEFSRMVTSRRSVRAFLPDPVDQTLIGKLFTLAASAPSNGYKDKTSPENQVRPSRATLSESTFFYE
jgi:nitroreductase